MLEYLSYYNFNIEHKSLIVDSYDTLIPKARKVLKTVGSAD